MFTRMLQACMSIITILMIICGLFLVANSKDASGIIGIIVIFCLFLSVSWIGAQIKVFMSKLIEKSVVLFVLIFMFSSISVYANGDGGYAGDDRHYTNYGNSGKCGSNISWVYDSNKKVLKLYGSGSTYNYNPGNGVHFSIWADNTYYTVNKIIIGEGITQISDSTFMGMVGSCEIQLPVSLKIIGQFAFQGSEVKKVVVPKSVEKIDNYAFADCNKLQSIDLEKCKKLKRIEPYVFDFCSSLKEINIPANVEDISEGAFHMCKNLKKITFEGAKLTVIKKSAFSGCGSLKKIIITGLVKQIGREAFKGCKKLDSIKIKTKTLVEKNVGKDAFKDVNISNLTVPSSFETPPTKVDGSKYKDLYKRIIVNKGGKIGKVSVSTDINSFNQTISPFQYKIISTGKIGAKKENGMWYYTFTKSGNVVRVKASAFYKDQKNLNSSIRVKNLNSQLSNTFKTKNPVRRDYFYKSDISKIKKSVGEKYNVYSITIYPLYVQSIYNEEKANVSIAVGCQEQNESYPQVTFSYSDQIKSATAIRKIEKSSKVLGKMVKPANADEYIKALSRTKTNRFIIPQTSISVKKAGENLNYLMAYRYSCKGMVAKKDNIDEWINVISTLDKLVNTSSAYGVAKTAFSLFKQGIDINSNENKFDMAATSILSGDVNGGVYKTLEASFKSPFKIGNSGDYFQVDVDLYKKLSNDGKIDLKFEMEK